ncbi:hypothetical protein PZF67_006328 [Pseudomonas aeruginosa]|uniref:hypothetical protein n=1 Tax=Pseudomonas aeruginosa TaxID=287 RepID=UPI0025CB350B|nr:hypothetical protein [Pseudomonas aeruginosa]
MKKLLLAMMVFSSAVLAAAPAANVAENNAEPTLASICEIWRQDARTCGCTQQKLMNQYGFTAEELWRFSQKGYRSSTIAEKNRVARYGLSVREIGMSCHGWRQL